MEQVRIWMRTNKLRLDPDQTLTWGVHCPGKLRSAGWTPRCGWIKHVVAAVANSA